jgi:hypothetical protein
MLKATIWGIKIRNTVTDNVAINAQRLFMRAMRTMKLPLSLPGAKSFKTGLLAIIPTPRATLNKSELSIMKKIPILLFPWA